MIDPLTRRLYLFLGERPRRAIEARDPYCLGSTVGTVRPRNEDVAAVVSVRYGGSGEYDFDIAVVCDGMGGMAHGREAALLASSSFLSRFVRAGRHVAPHERLQLALETAQLEVYERLRGGGGTTLSAIYADRTCNTWFAHVGDSRVYGLNSGTASLRQLSRSDTIGAALNRDTEGRADLDRLIQFVGMDDDLVGQIERIAPDEFDGLLLTSDGAHSAPKEVLEAVFRHSKNGADLVRKLLNVADALGGLDNATAVYVPAMIQSEPERDAGSMPSIAILTPSGEREVWIGMGLDGPESRSISPPPAPPPSLPVQPVHVSEKNAPHKKRSSKRKSARPARGTSDGIEPVEDLGPAKLDFSDDVGS